MSSGVVKSLTIAVCMLLFSGASYAKEILPCDPKPVLQCDAQCIKKIQNKLDIFRLKNNIPGIQITLSFANQPRPILLTFCSGTTEKGGTTPIGKNSLFEIGSTTKSFTAAILLQLESEKKVKLTDTVGSWLGDEYPAWKNMTIDQLLHMTAGTFDYAHDNNFDHEIAKDPERIWKVNELLNWGYSHGPLCNRFSAETPYCPLQPGEGWSYSSTNYILAEEIINKIIATTEHRNVSFADLLKERLINPLQLTHTLYEMKQNPLTIDNLVHGYNRTPTSPFYNQDVTHNSLSCVRGAGGMISNSEDLVIWIRALLTDNILAPEQLRKFKKETVCTGTDDSNCLAGRVIPAYGESRGYSYGVIKEQEIAPDNTMWWHSGETDGYYATFVYVTKTNFAIAATANTQVPLENLCFDIYRNLFLTSITHSLGRSFGS